MKKILELSLAYILTLCANIYAFAQDIPEKVAVNNNTDKGESVWYGQPWVWEIGIAYLF